jgi:amino acid transporter, AAT family
LAWRGIRKPDAQVRASTFSAFVADSTLAPQLERRLTQRQLTMMTMGGAIGVGLFLGSSLSIQLAGPGVILSYLFGAVITLIVAYSIAEMAVVHPVAGSFGVYAQTYLNEWSGYAVRVTYAFVQIIAIGAEVTAVAIYFAAWFPAAPQWLIVAAVSSGLLAINAMQVGSFAEFEYWFAILKVIAIAAFVLIGFALIVGLGTSRPIGLSNLTGHGGFLPHGMKGVWLAMTLTLTSYMGIEIIGVTAGEVDQPTKTVPRATR